MGCRLRVFLPSVDEIEEFRSPELKNHYTDVDVDNISVTFT